MSQHFLLTDDWLRQVGDCWSVTGRLQRSFAMCCVADNRIEYYSKTVCVSTSDKLARRLENDEW